MANQVSEPEDESIRVVLQVPNHDSLEELLTTVSGSSMAAQTRSIAPATLSNDTSVSIDLDILTEKQLETLEIALDKGYYDRPREASLDDIASLFDISKSAVSQRLRSAEGKIIQDAFGQMA
jgi:predicted DNA binding protein